MIWLLTVAFSWGQLSEKFQAIDARFKPIEAYTAINTTEQHMMLFVPRTEWQQQIKGRDAEMADLKASTARIETKVDRLLIVTARDK